MRTTRRYVCYATTSIGTKRVRGDRLTLLADFGVTIHTVLNLRGADPVRRRDGRGGGGGRGGGDMYNTDTPIRLYTTCILVFITGIDIV